MDDLLIKYVLGEATDDEAAQVERWLQADAANRKRLEQFRSVWALGRRMAAEEVERAGKWESGKVGASRAAGIWQERKVVKRMRTGSQKVWLAAAVIGILLLGAGGYLLLMTRQPVAATAPVAGEVRSGAVRSVGEASPTVKSPAMPEAQSRQDRAVRPWRKVKLLAGDRPMTDTLPDGTVVTLNRGAALETVGGGVEKGLTVRLKGEGFFTVTHDPSRAFVVQLGPMAIQVLGTSFEVNGISEDSIELVVETGAVRVGDRVVEKGAVKVEDRVLGTGRGDSVVVHAGERLSVSGSGGWIKKHNEDKLYGYYLGRPLVCDNTPLRKLVEVLNRASDTPIVLGRKKLGDLPLTTIFRGQSRDRILKIVALTFDLSVERQQAAIILQ